MSGCCTSAQGASQQGGCGTRGIPKFPMRCSPKFPSPSPRTPNLRLELHSSLFHRSLQPSSPHSQHPLQSTHPHNCPLCENRRVLRATELDQRETVLFQARPFIVLELFHCPRTWKTLDTPGSPEILILAALFEQAKTTTTGMNHMNTQAYERVIDLNLTCLGLKKPLKPL